MPPQVLHVAGQVCEQHLNLLMPLGLQEEALVVAASEKERLLSRLDWSISDPISFLLLVWHENGCVRPPSLASFHFHLALILCPWPSRQLGTEPPIRPTPAASSRQEEAGFALGGAEKLKVGATGAQSSLVVLFRQA